MTDNDTGGWPLGELLANSYKLAIKEATQLKALNAELLAALEQAIAFLNHKDILDEFSGRQAYHFVDETARLITRAKELTQ